MIDEKVNQMANIANDELYRWINQNLIGRVIMRSFSDVDETSENPSCVYYYIVDSYKTQDNVYMIANTIYKSWNKDKDMWSYSLQSKQKVPVTSKNIGTFVENKLFNREIRNWYNDSITYIENTLSDMMISIKKKK